MIGRDAGSCPVQPVHSSLAPWPNLHLLQSQVKDQEEQRRRRQMTTTAGHSFPSALCDDDNNNNTTQTKQNKIDEMIPHKTLGTRHFFSFFFSCNSDILLRLSVCERESQTEFYIMFVCLFGKGTIELFAKLLISSIQLHVGGGCGGCVGIIR